MEYKIRSYPQFSACGLNCGLCPRYYTDGASRCPGCAAEGFGAVHPPCGELSCCQRNGFEYCFECSEYPCKKYDGADLNDSFITHKNQFSDMEKAKQIGMEAYKAELDEKIELLEKLLESYNDGRRKGFYCLAVNLLELSDIKAVMGQLGGAVDSAMPIKEKAKTVANLFQAMADKRNISLVLRKN
ncbi:MAG: DUF3795 domain-containing protein [Oscillospiraceae bacterium]|nr:DUF3795 domain-containing protein [Oscillospiraceae bacterium]